MGNPAEFSNGFLSDLAPLISLFGEQVTKQFMSQTMYWSDHIIFAMAPLGILTAVVSAIRVAGPNWMKAIIGRSHECRALSQLELLSCTSCEICEMWNGRQIVRILGSAPVKQFLYFPHRSNDEQFGLYTLEDANVQGILKHEKDSSWFDKFLDRLKCTLRRTHNPATDLGRGAGLPDARASNIWTMYAPNITLNFSDPVNRWQLRATALFAICLQLSVVAYEGFTRYYQAGIVHSTGESLVGPSAFILAAIGTILLSLGMTLCSYAVEQCTEEYIWTPVGKFKGEFYLFWVQKGQVVNDQEFGSYLIVANGKRRGLLTSHVDPSIQSRDEGNHGPNGQSQQRYGGMDEECQNPLGRGIGLEPDNEHASDSRFLEMVTITGAINVIAGFALQFSGLRGLHWTAMPVQIAATFIMTIIRTLVRRNLTASQPISCPLPAGHELDWLAMQLGNEKLFCEDANSPQNTTHDANPCHDSQTPFIANVISTFRSFTTSRSSTSSRNKFQAWLDTICDIKLGWDIHCYEHTTTRENYDKNVAARTLSIRERLGCLTGWQGPASEEAFSLTKAMEVILNKLPAEQPLPTGFTQEIKCQVEIYLQVRGSGTVESEKLHLSFQRGSTESDKWEANDAQVEALLSLWLFSLSRGPQSSVNERGNHRRRGQVAKRVDVERIRLLGHISTQTARDFRWWLSSGLHKFLKVQEFLKVQNDDHEPKGTHASKESIKIKIKKDHEPINGITPRWYRFFGYGSNHPIGFPTIYPQLPNYTVEQFPETEVKKIAFHVGGTSTNKQPSAETYFGVSSNTLPASVCAQHLFCMFLVHQSSGIAQLEGQTRAEAKFNPRFPTEFDLSLHNTTLEDLAECVAETGLCSLEEAYFCIIPPLSLHKKLPRVDSIIHRVRKEAEHHLSIGHWNEAAQLYLGLFKVFHSFGPSDQLAIKATCLLVEFTRSMYATVDLWEKQYHQGPFLDEHKQIANDLWKVLEDDSDFKQLSKQLLASSTMCGKLPHWVPSCWNEKEIVPWHDRALHTGFHKKCLEEAGWAVGKFLLSHRDTDTNRLDVFDRGPLHYAAANRGDTTKYLLEDGANPLLKDILDWTPLHYAAWCGNAKSARRLVLAGAEINAAGRDGMTPLHCAAAGKSIEIADLLLGASADVEKQDNGRRTPLHWAAFSGCPEVADLLLKKGAYPRCCDEYRRTPLHLASLRCLETVQSLLQHHSGLVHEGETILLRDAKDRDGSSALHLAARAGLADVVRRLLEEKADIEVRDQSGYTALHVAMMAGRQSVVKLLLLEKNARWDASNNDGLTSMEIAFGAYNESMIELLMGPSGGDFREKGIFPKLCMFKTVVIGKRDIAIRTELGEGEKQGKIQLDMYLAALHNAACSGDINGVNRLLEREDIELDGRDPAGKTALIHATLNGSVELVEALLEKGADIEAANNYGSTPLHFAALKGHKPVVELLLRKGAKLEHVNYFGNGALHNAGWSGSLETIKFLFDNGIPNTAITCGSTVYHYTVASGEVGSLGYLMDRYKVGPKCVNKFGHNLLHVATMSGNKEMVEFLISKKFDVNCRDRYGTTPLHFGAIGGAVDVIDILVREGAVVDGQDEEGNSALHFAAMCGLKVVVARLKHHGACIDLADNYGHTALHLAVIHGQKEVVKYVLDNTRTTQSRDKFRRTIWDLAENLVECSAKQVILKLLGPKT